MNQRHPSTHTESSRPEDFSDCPVACRAGAPLAPHTTYRLGGPADLLLLPGSASEFVDAVRWAGRHGLPVTVLGGGSNVLVADGGIAGAVIVTTGVSAAEADGTVVTAEAGIDMNALGEFCADRNLAGVANFYGMPGTLGGAVMMNARCYDHSIEEILLDVAAVDTSGALHTLTRADCRFAYKDSRFQSGGEWVVSVRLQLRPGESVNALHREMERRRQHRADMGQYRFPNAGCVFKNNYAVGIPSGRLIESCGLKGFRAGGAEVYPSHANFVINTGTATAADILAVIRHVEAVVLEKTGIQLEREVRLLGRWQSVFPGGKTS
jgi:UDP-N-acetylmuramate dehydrogenase